MPTNDDQGDQADTQPETVTSSLSATFVDDLDGSDLAFFDSLRDVCDHFEDNGLPTDLERRLVDVVLDYYASCLPEGGLDDEDADVTVWFKRLIATLEGDDGAPIEDVLQAADDAGIPRAKANHALWKLKNKGEIYEPISGYLRCT